MFWTACEEWKKKHRKSGKLDLALGRTIFATHIEQGAALQVNISSSAQAAVSRDFEAETVSVETFDAAVGQVFVMLRDDLFPRFRKTDTFKKMLA